MSRNQFKKINTIYGRLLPKNIAQLKPWYLVHVELIGPYSKSIRKHQPVGAIIKDNFSLTCMTKIDPTTGWFEIVKIPTYNLDEVTGGNYEYIYKTSARVSQFFNSTCLSIFPHPQKVVFDNRSEFKRDFTPLLNDSICPDD